MPKTAFQNFKSSVASRPKTNNLGSNRKTFTSYPKHINNNNERLNQS